MLKVLQINRLALITELELDCKPGLTVVSGETGSGKSILIQALSILSGAQIKRETIQTGCKTGSVEAIFTDVDAVIDMAGFQNLNLDIEQGEQIVLRREIQRRGRSRFLINDQIVRKDDFCWIASLLLDVNSQHSHQKLLRTSQHLSLLDGVLPEKSVRDNVKSIWQKWHDISAEYQRLKIETEEMSRRRQLIQYQIAEIDDAGLRPGEKEELIDERNRLSHSEDIQRNLVDALEYMDSSSSPGICESLAKIVSRIKKTAEKDTRLEILAEQAESLNLLAADLEHDLNVALDQVEVSPERLNSVMERLHTLQKVEGKFKNDISGIIQYRESLEIELSEFKSQKNRLAELLDQLKQVASEYFIADKRLSGYRKQSAGRLSKYMEKSLADLGMERSRFEVSFKKTPGIEEVATGIIPDWCTENGTDNIEFLISANPGVPLKPLASVASGGELSRIMLALKQFLEDTNEYQVLVFDEVDTGIGGTVAHVVAEQLRKLALKRQIICVSHLPQIAVSAHQHLRVEKKIEGDNSTVNIAYLTADERTNEIARMLGGDPKASIAVEHAKKLLAKYADPISVD